MAVLSAAGSRRVGEDGMGRHELHACGPADQGVAGVQAQVLSAVPGSVEYGVCDTSDTVSVLAIDQIRCTY